MFKRRTTNKRVEKRHRFYRMSRSLLDWAKLMGGIVVISLVVFGMYQFFVCSSYFELRKVEVSGELKHISRGNLIRLAKVPYGKNLFAVSLRQISKNVHRHPWIHHVQVRRQFPHTLSMYVKEHEKFAVLVVSKKGKDSSDSYYMNNQGTLFRKASGVKNHDLPLITGFKKEGLKNYPSYFRPKVKETFDFLQTFLKVSASQTFVVKEIHYNITEGIWVSVNKGGDTPTMAIYFGKTNLNESLSRWDQFIKTIGDKKWFKSVDLQVKDKIFARI